MEQNPFGESRSLHENKSIPGLIDALCGMTESESRIYTDGRLHGQNTIVERQLRMIHIAGSIGNGPYGEAQTREDLRAHSEPFTPFCEIKDL